MVYKRTSYEISMIWRYPYWKPPHGPSVNQKARCCEERLRLDDQPHCLLKLHFLVENEEFQQLNGHLNMVFISEVQL